MLSCAKKFSGTLLAVLVLASASAMADTCNNFATYVCAQSTPNTVHVIGQGATNSSVGTTGGLITGTSFGVTMVGKGSAGDIVIIAAFTGLAPSGTLNGTAFTQIGTFPEGGALGAINTTLQALHLGSQANSFGYVDLHSALGAGQTLTVNMNGMPAGTAIYALALNQVTICKHHTCTSSLQISNITPNSEAGFTGGSGGVVTPEPGTLSLLGTGLLGLAGMVRRRFAR